MVADHHHHHHHQPLLPLPAAEEVGLLPTPVVGEDNDQMAEELDNVDLGVAYYLLSLDLIRGCKILMDSGFSIRAKELMHKICARRAMTMAYKKYVAAIIQAKQQYHTISVVSSTVFFCFLFRPYHHSIR